jgi:hypothetical protein
VVVVMVTVGSQGIPLPSHVQEVVRQFFSTFRLQVRNAEPVSLPHAAATSSEQTLAPHGRVAIATETSVPTPRAAIARMPTARLPVIAVVL